MADSVANFAFSTVATAPSPATTGTSLVVASGEGTLFPAVPFNAVVYPSDADPSTSNAEIVRVTAVSTDTLTITREQESTSARTIATGDRIHAGISKTFLESLVANSLFNAHTILTADSDDTPAALSIAASRIVARLASGNIKAATLTEILDLVGSAANGDILMRSGGSWTRLAKGTDGQVLTLASGLPSWAAAAGVDGAKLDAIEAGATADQTGAEIKAAYEAEADTNAFTDAEKSKLAAVEAGATADQSDAEILAAVESESGRDMSVDGAKLDSLDRALYVDAGAMVPRTDSGAEAVTRETTTNKVNLDALAFDAGSVEFGQCKFAIPTWMIDGFKVYVIWGAESGSGGVTFGVAARAFGDDDARDQAMGTRVDVDDTLITGDVCVSAISGEIDFGGTPVAQKLGVLEISRQVGDANDTLAVDADLYGILILPA